MFVYLSEVVEGFVMFVWQGIQKIVFFRGGFRLVFFGQWLGLGFVFRAFSGVPFSSGKAWCETFPQPLRVAFSAWFSVSWRWQFPAPKPNLFALGFCCK